MNQHPIFIIALFVSVLSYSQSKINTAYSNTPLKEVVADIESQTDILFSYSQEVISSKTITLKEQEISIDDLLVALATQTGLIFEKVSAKQIIIAQRKMICGYLTDAVTQKSLPFVTVIINEDINTTTDDKGYFTVEDNSLGSENVQFRFIGYEDQEVTITVGDPCPTIALVPLSSTLDEVVVLGYVTSGIDRNKDGSISIDSEKLGILPGLVSPDISQSIQLIPGISTLDESATGIQIRGGSPDQNLILYDDIKLYNTGYFYGMFSLFNPFATQKARVFRSGTSATYGDRISGIIDISSGDLIPEKTEGGVEIDGLSVNGYIKAPLSEKVAVYAFARRSYADVVETPTYISYADKIFTNFGVARDINGNVLELETDDDFSRESSNSDFFFQRYECQSGIETEC